MVPRFWSHGRQPAVFARTGATPVHAGAEARNSGPVRLRISRKFADKYEGIFIPYRLTQKTKKNAPSPLKFPKDFNFWGTWDEGLLWKTKYSL